MAVANAWGVGTITPSTPNHYLDHFRKKDSSNLSMGCINISTSRNSSLSCNCTTSSSSSSSSSSEWDWNRWTRHFKDMEQAESYSSVLKFQLEEAVEKEDFQEAAKLKKAIAETTSKDTVAEIMCQLKNAVDEERYHDASRLCKLTPSGLVGWWAGCSKDCNDPFGTVVQITPAVGRFVARSYTPRQLVTASSGTPVFEIFVSKVADQTYTMQVVYLQRAKESPTGITMSPSLSKRTADTLSPSSENSSTRSSLGNESSTAEGSEVNNINTKDANNIVDSSEEALKSVINYLKERIPGAKFKVMNSNVPKEVAGDSESMEQVVHDDDDDDDDNDDDDEQSSSLENSEDDLSNNHILSDRTRLDGATNSGNAEKHAATKLFIGGILHNKEDTPLKDDYIRSAAEIMDMERDSFILHIPGRSKDEDIGESFLSTPEMESVAAQSASELMPLEVARAFIGGNKNPSKGSRNFHEIFKLAGSIRNGLSRNTSFSRITPSKDNIDPFDGLYVGAFGPLGAELVQLRRKFGHWQSGSAVPDVEFFEYVEAVKLTGDLNVPAGKVTFRARIGKGMKNSNRGKYPDELGVVASYRGEGTIADIGFRNPRWVEGELLQLSGRGMWPHIGGADLGFLYVVPEKSFLVLLNRVTLPES